MKNRFTSVDIIAVVKEITENVVGKRVVQVYDIDNKTFLIKLSRSGEDGKSVLLIESGIRIHITEFEWQKNITPSGFSMKLRKHIKNRRLESIKQIGTDRIIDLQFGSNEGAYHIIAELYDRGNMVLTDHEYTIMHLIRPRVDNMNEQKFQTKEQYPISKPDELSFKSNKDYYIQLLNDNFVKCKQSDNLRKMCSSIFTYGPNLLEHCLLDRGFTLNMKISQCLKDNSQLEFIEKLFTVFVASQDFIDNFKTLKTEGYIIGKSGKNDDIEVYDEFHPYIYRQLENKENIKQMPTFNQAVDEYFSAIKSQKSEQQMHQKERAAMKKLENIQFDRERRLKELKVTQENDLVKGELIQMNADMINRAILILNNAIANKMSWENIEDMVKEGKEAQDPVANSIIKMNFEHSQITVRLQDPYADDEDNEEEFIDTTIDLTLNAYENARFYFTQKKQAKTKEDRTIDATEKAFKSAEKKTNQMLKEVKVVSKINKIRKTNWFEKFNWFISSEKYLVIGGKDMQQNEFIVKRYFRPGDVYVHADIHGASTVIIKNHNYPAVPEISPKTLTEAGQMAVVYSSAWEHKIASSSWWVYYDQVSKTAPSGEYLTTGSFMIRGKKNYLPTQMLTYGFGIIFKVSEESVERRAEVEKSKPEILNDPAINKSDQASSYKDEVADMEEEMQEMNMEQVDDDDDDEVDENEFPDATIEIKSEPLPIQIEEDIDNQKSHKYKTAKEKRDQKKQNTKTSKQVSFEDEIQVKPDENDETEDKEGETNDAKGNDSDSDDQNTLKHQEQQKGPQPLKRGQKSKLKKMKKKYKDQDEDERELKIAILQGRNPYEEGETLKPLTKKQKKKIEEEEKLQRKEERLKQQLERKQKQIQKFQENQRQRKLSNNHDDDNESEDEDDQNPQRIGQLDVLPSLTGQPDPEDELMYAMSMLAPYAALQNFKYKVKMIPGTTKRGRAAKNILFNLMNDKTAPDAEKNQIRALKDQDVTRNFPGKVNVMIQHAFKKYKK